MDGGKYVAILIESSQVPFSTTTLCIQHGPDWLTDIWKLAFSSIGDVLVKFPNNRKDRTPLTLLEKI